MTRRHPSRGRSPSRRSPRSSSYCPFSGPWRWACTCPTGRRPPRTRRPRTFPRSSRGGRRRPAGGPTWPSCARRRRGRRSPTAGWTAAPGWCSCPSGGPWSWSSGSTGAASDMKDEVTAADSSPRAPLLVLLLAALAWLVAAGLLGLVASIQLHSPRFLSACPVLTYGRMAALAETAFVYGWLANAGLALALWILGRLAGEPLRAQGWAVGGAVFWNLGVAAALGGVATGDATGFALLGLPAYVHMILLFSYSAIAVTGILSWSGRMRRVPYASQWDAAAALFTFPWILSIAHVMLFSAPARGVVQAVAAGWYAQCAWTLWLAPLGLSVAYYVVPRATGRVLPSYEFASLGFWCLVFVGGLTGGRHLLGGPVPAWIASVAVVSAALLLFHVLIVFLNLRGCFSGGGIALRFTAFGIAAYAVGALADAATSFHGVAAQTQFTYFDEAARQLALYGAVSTMLFGGIYFAVPRITGRAWFSAGLVRAHLLLTIGGILLLAGALCGAALVQGRDLADSAVAFAAIAHHTRPWLAAATAAQAILLLGNMALAMNFVGTACRILNVSEPASFNPPSAIEAHAPGGTTPASSSASAPRWRSPGRESSSGPMRSWDSSRPITTTTRGQASRSGCRARPRRASWPTGTSAARPATPSRCAGRASAPTRRGGGARARVSPATTSTSLSRSSAWRGSVPTWPTSPTASRPPRMRRTSFACSTRDRRACRRTASSSRSAGSAPEPSTRTWR